MKKGVLYPSEGRATPPYSVYSLCFLKAHIAYYWHSRNDKLYRVGVAPCEPTKPLNSCPNLVIPSFWGSRLAASLHCSSYWSTWVRVRSYVQKQWAGLSVRNGTPPVQASHIGSSTADAVETIERKPTGASWIRFRSFLISELWDFLRFRLSKKGSELEGDSERGSWKGSSRLIHVGVTQ